MPKGPSLFAGLSSEIRASIKQHLGDHVPRDQGQQSAKDGPGPSTEQARAKAASVAAGEVRPSKRKRVESAVNSSKHPHDASHLATRYTSSNWESMPAEIQRYFPQRNSLFSRYTSHDILLDHVGWYSVTPEKIAQHQAERCQCDTVLDAFAGVGGNAIAFAFTCERVIAMDKSMERLKIARHNARAYGVEDRIEWICSDYVEFVEAWVKRKKAEHVDGELGNEIDVVFLSPPWGGTDYLTAESAAGPEASAPVIKNDHQLPNHLPPFDLSHLLPLPGSQLYKLTRNLSPNMAMFLPRNSDPNEIASWADLHHGEIGSDGEPLKEWVEVEEEWMGHSTMDPFQEPTSNRQKKKKQARMSAGGQRPNEGKLKALTAYFGGLVGGNEAI